MDNNNSQILIYQTEDGQTKIDVRLQDETVWLTQRMLAELFQTTKQNISAHLINIYQEGELQEDRTVKKFLTVQTEGTREVSREIEYGHPVSPMGNAAYSRIHCQRFRVGR